MSEANIYDALTAEFDKSSIKQVDKGNRTLDYIPISEVVDRLNRTLGVTGWSEEDSQSWQLGDEWVLAKTTLVYTDPDTGAQAKRIGYGGVKIKFTKSGDPVDIGDEFKGAHSDALKKAAQGLGVGLYLARDAAAKKPSSSGGSSSKKSTAKRTAKKTASKPKSTSSKEIKGFPATDEAREELKKRIGGLTEDEVEALQQYWAKEIRVPIDNEDKFTDTHIEHIEKFLDQL